MRQASPEPGTISSPGYDAILDRLKGEFIEFAKDTLVELDNLLEAGQGQKGAQEQIIDAIRRNAHDLKGTGGSFGFPLISLLAYRMEAFFMGRRDLDREVLTDAQCFVDHMREALEGRFDGVSEADVVQSLPTNANFEAAEAVK